MDMERGGGVGEGGPEESYCAEHCQPIATPAITLTVSMSEGRGLRAEGWGRRHALDKVHPDRPSPPEGSGGGKEGVGGFPMTRVPVRQ